jgi:hypothetical protein
MKKFIVILALLAGLSATGQPKVLVQVYPGTELLNVVQLLADTTKGVKSTYKEAIIRYFWKYKDHSAVKMARALPFINCDFPVRLSWAFYDFPKVKVHTLDTLGGYEPWFKKEQINAYFRECVKFCDESHFWSFYQNEQPEYQRWIVSFDRNLYEQKMLSTLDSFYRLTPEKEIIFTLGALNCNSYAVPEMRLVNPKYSDKIVIMVAYGNVVRGKDSLNKQPDFFAPSWATQLVWHEMGHAYLGSVFKKYAADVASLNYLAARDSLMRKAQGKMTWSTYLNENVTQAVTSLLRIRKGLNSREAEIKRITVSQFYLLSPAIMEILGKDYYGQNKYENFSVFFPVLISELKQKFPE